MFPNKCKSPPTKFRKRFLCNSEDNNFSNDVYQMMCTYLDVYFDL